MKEAVMENVEQYLNAKGSINADRLTNDGYTIYWDYQPLITFVNSDGGKTVISSVVIFKRPSESDDNKIDAIIFKMEPKSGRFIPELFDNIRLDQIKLGDVSKKG